MNVPPVGATTSRPSRPRRGLRLWMVAGALPAYTLFAGRKVGFDVSSFWSVWSNPLWGKF